MSAVSEVAMTRTTSQSAKRQSAAPVSKDGEAGAHASRTMGQLGHELRTPLGAILGFASLLESDGVEPLSDAQKRRIAIIQQAGQHMLGIISRVLEESAQASRAASEQAVPSSVALASASEEVLQWLAPMAQKYGVTMSMDAMTAQVRANPETVRQVLLNLVSNAIKYNRRGGHVHLRQVSDEHSGLAGLEVRDTGCGMSLTTQANLFQPFDRLGQESTEIEGTGLGLCIAQEQLERLGGHIAVRSTPCVGSAFTMWLPQDH